MNEFKSKAQSEEIWKVLSNARTVGNFSKKSKKNIGWIVFCKIDGAHKRLGIFATEEETDSLIIEMNRSFPAQISN